MNTMELSQMFKRRSNEPPGAEDAHAHNVKTRHDFGNPLRNKMCIFMRNNKIIILFKLHNGIYYCFGLFLVGER